MRSIIKELMAHDGKRKVQIFRREDGTFGFEALRFSDETLEMCWIPDGRYSECFTGDEQTAESEARSRVPWLQNG
ncbi:MAG TPA: hypothetical protein DIW61_08605 [Candidatus Aminicenantes bacterium]|nr:hypothetical protein [Candidatus Aminicenantes bacterium]